MADNTAKTRRPSYGHIVRTVIGLVIACFIVGAVLSFLGVDPVDFWRGLWERLGDFVSAIVSLGWGAFATLFSYIMIGAIVVIPIWAVVWLVNLRKR